MNGLSVLKRTASTSISILAVSSAINCLSGNPLPRFMCCPFRFDPAKKIAASCGGDLPLDRLAAAMDEGALVRSFDLDLFGRGPGFAFEGDPLFVGRQPVMRRPVQRGEGFELVERVLLRENLNVALDRHRRIEEA